MMMIRPLFAPAFAVFALVAASSCAAPLQSGGVTVRPGAEERLEVVCRYAGGQKVCEAPIDQEE